MSKTSPTGTSRRSPATARGRSSTARSTGCTKKNNTDDLYSRVIPIPYPKVGERNSACRVGVVSAAGGDTRWMNVPGDRVGSWGWSGGGSMSLNAIFRYPDLYHTAIAIAFISDQRFYDTIYQERYMGLPADNPAGFRVGSPISFALQLKGNLLLIHGTGDDNCHYQSCAALINKLIEANKPFTMMAYPNRTHSISEGKNTRQHMFELMTRYLNQTLPPGPRAADEKCQ